MEGGGRPEVWARVLVRPCGGAHGDGALPLPELKTRSRNPFPHRSPTPTHRYNRRTRKSSWVPPSPDDGWAELTDEKSGRTYFYNARLRRSSWARPSPTPKDGDEGDGPEKGDRLDRLDRRNSVINRLDDAVRRGAAPADAADEWVVTRAPNGRKYFYNRRTRKSAWTAPLELQQQQQQKAPDASAPTLTSGAAQLRRENLCGESYSPESSKSGANSRHFKAGNLCLLSRLS